MKKRSKQTPRARELKNRRAAARPKAKAPKPRAAKAAAQPPHARPAGWLKGERPIGELMAPTRMPGDIKVGERHRKDMGDIAALARDINERGLLQPVVVDRDGVLIAGERRLKAWQLSMFREQPIPVHVVPLADIVAGEWAENDPALRKDFLPSEAVAIRRVIEAKLAPAAAANKGGRGRKADNKERAGDRAASFTGKGRRTIEKAEKIVEAAEAEPERYGGLLRDMDKTGRVDGPYKRLAVMKAAEEIRAEAPPLPGNGPYRGFVIDFPWAAEPEADDAERLARGYYPYPTMSLRKCVAFARERIAPLLHEECAGAIWITNYHLALGHHVPIMEALGVTPVTIRTWVKDRIGRGQVLRGQTEHAVIVRRGKPAFVAGNLSTFFHAAIDKKHHSRKPQKFYDDFERLVAAPRYASFFETADRGTTWDGHGDKMPARPAEAA
jgi:N6-adenosine-specific RNA methylase IME4